MPISPPQGVGSPSLKQSVQKPKQNPDKRGEERRDKDREDSAWSLPHKDRNLLGHRAFPSQRMLAKLWHPDSG